MVVRWFSHGVSSKLSRQSGLGDSEYSRTRSLQSYRLAGIPLSERVSLSAPICHIGDLHASPTCHHEGGSDMGMAPHYWYPPKIVIARP